MRDEIYIFFVENPPKRNCNKVTSLIINSSYTSMTRIIKSRNI